MRTENRNIIDNYLFIFLNLLTEKNDQVLNGGIIWIPNHIQSEITSKKKNEILK